MTRIIHYLRHLQDRIRLNKWSFLVYSILRILVIVTAIRCIATRNYESLMLCILSLLLLLLPSLFEEALRVDIPPLFEAIIYLFIFAAEILGEVNHYYTSIPGWDTMLHTMNGFLCAAIGFSLADLMNRQGGTQKLSPLYLAIVAFCFSMTIGVLWEFFEFFFDQFFYLDMQKDFVVRTFSSVTLDPSASQIPRRLSGITHTLIEAADGSVTVIEEGYLDIGLIDTMKDLLVNFVGALVFSVIGYFYTLNRNTGTGKLARSLILRTLSEEDIKQQREQLEALTTARSASQDKRKRKHKKKMQTEEKRTKIR